MRALSVGEVPPTAGLAPRWDDLLAPHRGPTLEEAICLQLGLPDIEVVSTGTAGLLIALTYLKRRSSGRRTVIVPGYTCPLVAIAATAAGLRTVACDTVAGGFDLDAAHLARLINGDTLAVVPTHYGGALTDIARVRAITTAICREIAVIEDAAQAFGATWQGNSVGLAGDIGVFSFGAGKGFTIYEGGGLVARDPGILSGLRQVAAELTSGSALGEAWRALLLIGYHAVYNPVGVRAVYGVPKRFWLGSDDDVRAAGDKFPTSISVNRVGEWRKRVGRAAFARLPTHLAQSRARFAQLVGRIAEIPGIKVHLPEQGTVPTGTFVFVSLPTSARSHTSIQNLWRSRLGVAKLFSRAIGDYPDISPLLQPGDTPNARTLAATTITVSTSDALSPAAETAILCALDQAGQCR